MPAIEPVPWEHLDPVLREELDGRTASRTLSSTIPLQVWGHRPAAATAWVRLLAELQERGLLDERVRELCRLRIADITQCRTCLTGRKSDLVSEDDISCIAVDDARFSEQERAAMRYAELFAADWMSVDDDTYRELARHFTLEQIVELQMYCAMMLAGGRLAFVQRAWVDDDRAPVLGGTPCA